MSDRVISEKYNLPANTVGRYRGRKYLSDSNNPSLNFMIWNWQNLPGINNTKTYQGKQLRNLWDIYG